MGLFNPRSREEQARYVCCENARFREDLRENKRKNGAVRNVGHIPVFGLSDKTLEQPRLVRFAHSLTAARRETGVFSGHFRAPCTNSAQLIAKAKKEGRPMDVLLFYLSDKT